MKHRKFVLAAGVLLFSVVLAVQFAFAQRGALVTPANAAELAAQAQTIVRGHVLSAHVEPHPELSSLSTIVVTLKVEETLKGAPGRTYTFRQYIWDIRDRMDAAGYRKGQEYLLMMNAPNRYGLTSPAGMELGRFRVLRDNAGNIKVLNGYANYGLFRGMQTEATRNSVQLSSSVRALSQKHTRGAVSLDDLRTVIKQFGGAQ